jgi:hypothetical protein
MPSAPFVNRVACDESSLALGPDDGSGQIVRLDVANAEAPLLPTQ